MMTTGISRVGGLKRLEICGSSSLPAALCLYRSLIFMLTLQQNKPIFIANLVDSLVITMLQGTVLCRHNITNRISHMSELPNISSAC